MTPEEQAAQAFLKKLATVRYGTVQLSATIVNGNVQFLELTENHRSKPEDWLKK